MRSHSARRWLALLIGMTVVAGCSGSDTSPTESVAPTTPTRGGRDEPSTTGTTDSTAEPQTGPSSTVSETPVLPDRPPAPTERLVLDAARAATDGFPRGDVEWVAEPVSVTPGASLATATIRLSYDGTPIETSPALVTVDGSGSAVAVVAPETTAAGWDETRVLDRAERPPDVDLVALVAESLGLTNPTVEAITEVWIPVGDELRSGQAIVIASSDGRQRFRVAFDMTTMTVAAITPLRVLASAAECPEPEELAAPAACVGYPDPDTSTADRPLRHLDATTALEGRYARVVRGPDASFLEAEPDTIADTFDEPDGRWGGDVASLPAAASNAYYWMTEAGARIDGLGFGEFTQPPTDVVVTDRSFGGAIAVTRFDHVIGHGSVDDGHSGADAQVVLHEYGHVLFARAAPLAWGSEYQGAKAYHEATSDIVAWTMTVPLDLDDPGCLAPYVARRTDPPQPCLRRLDTHPDTPPRHYYEAGNPWRAAMYELLEQQTARAGESIDECLPESWCEVYSVALLATTLESWPLLNRERFTLADAAAAFTVANDTFGYFDADLVESAFADRPALSQPTAVTVSLTVQHPAPSALRGRFDVIDAEGDVVCEVADSLPLDALLVVDASACSAYLPAGADRVWRATVTTPEEQAEGRVLEFSVRVGDRSDASVRPEAASIGGPAGGSRQVVIPAGAGAGGALTHVDGVVAGSGVGIDAAAGVAVVVDILGPSVQAFDLETGERRWTKPYSYGTAYRGITAGFTMTAGKVITIAVDVDSQDRRIDDRPGVAAYAADTGDRVWFTPIAEPFSLQSCGADAVCVTHGDGGTRTRLAVADGKVLGDLPSEGDELPMAAIGDDLVSMTEGVAPRVRRWNPQSGATVWTQTPGAAITADTSGGWNTSHRPDLGVYLVSIGPASDLFGATDGYTAALDPDTGRELWSRRNSWLLPGFPDASVYLVTYEPGFGLNATARGMEVVRVDPLTGRVLSTLDPGADPLELTFLFDAAGVTAWWHDAEGTPLVGHDMRTDQPVEVRDAVAWEVVPREPMQAEGKVRSMPSGHQPIWITSGAPVVTTDVPGWVGAHAGGWFAYVTADGTVVIGRSGSVVR